MAIDIPDLPVGAISRTALNNRFAKIKAYLQSIPGAAIVAGSVTRDRLEQQRAIFTFDSRIEDLSDHANNDILDGFTLPQLDVANYLAWKFYSFSIFARAASAAGSNYLRIKNGVTTIKDVDLSLLAAGGPQSGTAAAAATGATADNWTIVYVKSGAPTLTDVTLRLFFSAQHITNY